MPEAFYHKGFAIEYNRAFKGVTIDGNPVPEEWTQALKEKLQSSYKDDKEAQLPVELTNYIENLPEFNQREIEKEKHIGILNEGVPSWNIWRKENPGIRPLLYDAELNNRKLEGIDFSNANLIEAKLRNAKLHRGNFHEANLGGANLTGADLRMANFCRTDLYKTILSEANLEMANLQGTQMAKTNLEGTKAHPTKLNNCTVYGIAAWDLKRESGIQESNLVVTLEEQGGIAVDGLDAAQLVFLLLNNPKISDVLDQVQEKTVLILGRFTEPERKEILKALKCVVRQNNYVPIVFDFDRPKNLDFTETVQVLAGLSRFVIADLTSPQSVPLELHALIPNFAIPFVPIIQRPQEPFSMFQDLLFKHKLWVLPPLQYTSKNDLIEVFREAILDEVKEIRETLQERKTDRVRDTADYKKRKRKIWNWLGKST